MKVLTEDKIMHSKAVAEYMFDHAEMYGQNPAEMYILGLLHDIGYLYGDDDPAESGAEILHQRGYKDAFFIKYQNTVPESSCMNQPLALILLRAADLSIDRKGNNVGFDKRLEEIAEHYGEDSHEYAVAKKQVDWIVKHYSKYLP